MNLFFWIFSLISFVISTDSAMEGTLRITVENIKENQGAILVAVYAEPENFLSETPYRGVHKVVNQWGKVTLDIPELPYGTYAVSLFHDENNNGELDTNFMKIPKEPYGFSNNARGIFGPPKFKDARFSFDDTSSEIRIEIK